jgi:hypothetical protein
MSLEIADLRQAPFGSRSLDTGNFQSADNLHVKARADGMQYDYFARELRVPVWQSIVLAEAGGAAKELFEAQTRDKRESSRKSGRRAQARRRARHA